MTSDGARQTARVINKATCMRSAPLCRDQLWRAEDVRLAHTIPQHPRNTAFVAKYSIPEKSHPAVFARGACGPHAARVRNGLFAAFSAIIVI